MALSRGAHRQGDRLKFTRVPMVIDDPSGCPCAPSSVVQRGLKENPPNGGVGIMPVTAKVPLSALYATLARMAGVDGVATALIASTSPVALTSVAVMPSPNVCCQTTMKAPVRSLRASPTPSLLVSPTDRVATRAPSGSSNTSATAAGALEWNARPN